MTVRIRLGGALAVVLFMAPLSAAVPADAQTGRQVKVVIEIRQQGTQSRQGVQGGGGVIIQQGKSPRAAGGLAADDTTTTTTRSSGVFVLVQDGGQGTMMVGQDIPYPQLAYYYDYATGKGYVAQGVAWQSVGTGLAVRPTVLPDGRIRVRLTPWLSYLTPGGGGTVEFVDAATELVVPNGRRVQIGGATSSLHSVTRQILGVRQEQSSGETGIVLTATLQ
jgi:type II secretory pathway component GspD/PulD (secretin)